MDGLCIFYDCYIIIILQMMSVAVLSILLTAPLGTVLMALTAQKLVRPDPEADTEMDVQDKTESMLLYKS